MKKIIKLLLISLLLMSCTKKETNVKDFPDLVWSDENLLAVGFIGYYNEIAFSDLTNLEDIQNFLAFYPNIDKIEKVRSGEGSEVYAIIPRNKQVKVTITNINTKEILYDSSAADLIFLFCNESDLVSDTNIDVKYQGKEFSYSFGVDLMDGSLQDWSTEIIDISVYYFMDFKDHLYDYHLLRGEWVSQYLNKEKQYIDMSLLFAINEVFDFNEGYFINYANYTQDLVYQGKVYFTSPEDYSDEFDSSYKLLYFDLTSLREIERYQIFGKFLFRFIDEDTLILKNFSYDPLTMQEDQLIYRLKRIER